MSDRPTDRPQIVCGAHRSQSLVRNLSAPDGYDPCPKCETERTPILDALVIAVPVVVAAVFALTCGILILRVWGAV